MRKHLPQSSEPASPERRKAVRSVGGWLIFSGAAGVMATIGACGPNAEVPEYDDDDDVSPNPSPSPTTPPICVCPTIAEGTLTPFTAASLTVGEYAFNAGLQVFVCRDALGFYAMSSICAHSSTNMGPMGTNMDYNNLAGGFLCTAHNSQYSPSGVCTSGPLGMVGVALIHYKVSFGPGGEIYIDKVAPFMTAECRCNPV